MTRRVHLVWDAINAILGATLGYGYLQEGRMILGIGWTLSSVVWVWTVFMDFNRNRDGSWPEREASS